MTTREVVLAFALTVTTLAGCKKDDKEPVVRPPKVNCDLLTEIKSEDGTYTYEYDAQERLVKVTTDNSGAISAKTVVYKDNGLTVVETAPHLIATYTLDVNKRPIVIEDNFNTGSRTVREIAYDATGNMVSIKEKRYESPDDNVPEEQSISLVHTMANGNVVKTVVTDDNTGEVLNVSNITHDLTRLDNIPNPQPYGGLFGNGYGGVSKNLPQSLVVVLDNSTQRAGFTYEFDAKGRVIARTTTAKYGDDDEVKLTNSYKYKCD